MTWRGCLIKHLKLLAVIHGPKSGRSKNVTFRKLLYDLWHFVERDGECFRFRAIEFIRVSLCKRRRDLLMNDFILLVGHSQFFKAWDGNCVGQHPRERFHTVQPLAQRWR